MENNPSLRYQYHHALRLIIWKHTRQYYDICKYPLENKRVLEFDRELLRENIKKTKDFKECPKNIPEEWKKF